MTRPLMWVLTKGGAWEAGPYVVVQRVDNKCWNVSALFEGPDNTEEEPQNSYIVIGMNCPTAEHAMREAAYFHMCVSHSIAKLEPIQ